MGLIFVIMHAGCIASCYRGVEYDVHWVRCAMVWSMMCSQYEALSWSAMYTDHVVSCFSVMVSAVRHKWSIPRWQGLIRRHRVQQAHRQPWPATCSSCWQLHSASEARDSVICSDWNVGICIQFTSRHWSSASCRCSICRTGFLLLHNEWTTKSHAWLVTGTTRGCANSQIAYLPTIVKWRSSTLADAATNSSCRYVENN